MPDEAKLVATTDVGEGFFVTTFFVGLDQSDGENAEPLVFKTIAGPKDESWYCDAYSTWQQAEDGHRDTVAHYRSLMEPVEGDIVH